MSKKGLTLIEMVAVIVILGLSIPVLMNMWASVAWRSGRSEAMGDATFYAQQLLEEIKTKRFDENNAGPWSASLGPDTSTKGLNGSNNETAVGMSNWDDVDDFNGYADTPATGYRRAVSVNYAMLNVSNVWQECSSVSSCVSRATCTNCNECCYKLIKVTVSRIDNLASGVSLATLVSGL